MGLKEIDTYIFKNLKSHLNELKRLRPQYEFVMIAVQGSQNYNLDLYNKEYKSDIDTVAMVLPSFDHFVNNDKMISEVIVLDNNEHIDIKDCRSLFELFKKQNIKYLELLFTKYRIINPYYKDIILKLMEYKEEIAHFDIPKLIRTTFGMAQEKLKAMEHPYEGLKDKIEKYGYDCKQTHHIVRLSEFLYQYCMFGSFEEAIHTYNYKPEMTKLLLDIKLNKFSLQEARELAENYIGLIKTLRDEYENNLVYTLKTDIEELLNKTQTSLFKTYFSNMFTPEEVRPKKVLTPSADKIYVTSDLHFGHENILNFEPKRWTLVNKTQAEAIVEYIKENEIDINKEDFEYIKSKVNKKYIQQHDESLIENWNNVVKNNNDLVFILGDFSFRNGEETNNILKRLRGRKVLVLGNHDNIFMNYPEFDPDLFEEIVQYKEIKVDKQHFIMMHYPIQVWNKSHKGSIHLYGHVHSNETTEHKMEHEIYNSYNVGADVNNFKPVSLKSYFKNI